MLGLEPAELSPRPGPDKLAPYMPRLTSFSGSTRGPSPTFQKSLSTGTSRGELSVRPTAPGQLPRLGPPVRVDGAPPGVQTAETSIVASPDGELLAAWGDTRLSQDASVWRIGYAVSPDRGDTWIEGLLGSPAAEAGEVQVEADPMTAWDPRTGLFWAGGISFAATPEAFVAEKPPGSLVFEPAVRIRADSDGVDKGFLAAGPDPRAPASTLLHFIDRRGLQTSEDLGATWSDLLFLGNLQGPLPRVGSDGELYIAFWNGVDGVQLLRSFDGGRTLEPRTFITRRNDTWDNLDGSRFPGRFRVPPLPYLAVDPVTGTLYCVYFDTTRQQGTERDVDLYLTRSDDRGDSWTEPRRIAFDPQNPQTDASQWSDQFFPWIEVDALGRLHMVFYDTRHVDQQDDQQSAHLDVYYAWSENRGESWTELRLTDQPFETGDIVWAAPQGQFVGDYLGLAVAGDTVHPLYPVAHAGDLDIWTRRLDFGVEGAPETVPPVPWGLTAGPETARAVRLSWQPTGPGTGVVVEARDLWTDEVMLLGAPPGALSFVVEDLEPDRPYSFRVATRALAGVSGWSDEVLAIPMDTRPGVCEPIDEEEPDAPEGSSAPPSPPATVLCLQDGRFRVRVVWRDPVRGGRGVGRAVPLILGDGRLSQSTGTFWFFHPDNVELVLKVHDGRPVNDRFWVFSGSLTGVEHWITVYDSATGASRIYPKPAGAQKGLVDTDAF